MATDKKAKLDYKKLTKENMHNYSIEEILDALPAPTEEEIKRSKAILEMARNRARLVKELNKLIPKEEAQLRTKAYLDTIAKELKSLPSECITKIRNSSTKEKAIKILEDELRIIINRIEPIMHL